MHRIGLAAVLLLVEVGVAVASPCSGGGSSSDDSSAFDDDDDDDNSGPSPSLWTGPPPRLRLELGFALRQMTSPLGSRTGSLSHEGEDFSYRVVNQRAEAALDTAVVIQARVGVPLPYGFYAAGEAELGGLTDHATRTEMTTSGTRGTPAIEQNAVQLFGAAIVLGAATQIGRVNLGLEAAGGFHAVSYGHTSTYGACETTSSVIAAGGLLEGRARASMWLSPHVALGAVAGKSMLDTAWMSGVYVGWHTTAFGK